MLGFFIVYIMIIIIWKYWACSSMSERRKKKLSYPESKTFKDYFSESITKGIPIERFNRDCGVLATNVYYV